MEHPENDDQYKGLKVNKGIADVPTVNPYIKKRAQRKVYTPSEFVEGILKGNITILSQAVTLVKALSMSTNRNAQEIIEKCLPFSWKIGPYRYYGWFPERERVPLSTLSACT